MQRFREILVFAPDATTTPDVLVRATRLAERNRARLTLFDVVPSVRSNKRTAKYGIDLQQLIADTRRSELETLASRVMTVEVRTAVGVGVAFVAIVQRVLSHGHDLVVAAPDHTGTTPGFAGATNTLHLLRKCPCPVWIDEQEASDRPDVLVAVGRPPGGRHIGELNQTLLSLGSSLAHIRGGALHIAHAWRLEGETLFRHGRVTVPSDYITLLIEDERRDAVMRMQEFAASVDLTSLDHELHLVEGHADEVIGKIVGSTKPGVVVMGSLARSGLAGVFVGNTAERLFGSLDCSVLAVKPPGFVSPVRLPAQDAARITV